MAKPYRSKSRLVMDVLSSLGTEGPVGVTRLLFIANLTHGRLQEHLDHMTDAGWATPQEIEGRQHWTLSDEGHKVLTELRRVDQAMQDFGLAL